MPQGLSDDRGTLYHLVVQLFRHHRAHAQTYFDDIVVHSRENQGWLDVDNSIDHLRALLE